VSQVFVRADSLADVIYDVKLYLTEWKVLFALDGTMDSKTLSSFLDIEQNDVEKALQRLKELNLISPVGETTIVEESKPEEEKEFETTPQEAESSLEEVTQDKSMEEHEKKETTEDKEKFTFDEESTEGEIEEFNLAGQESPAELSTKESVEEELTLKEEEEKKDEEEEKTESEEDLDQLINDLLKQESEETSNEKSSLTSEMDVTEETGENMPTTEETTTKEKTKDEFDFGEIFETELEETEQSLEEMLDTFEKESDVTEVEKGEIEAVPPTEAAKKTILVVDDSVVIRKMVEIALENENYEIVTVANGKDALSFLDKKEPDLIILDIMLPDVNGLDILKAIKASKNIPVVMLSAKDTPRETSKAKELGADDFIPKPFKDEELISKIHELIGE